MRRLGVVVASVVATAAVYSSSLVTPAVADLDPCLPPHLTTYTTTTSDPTTTTTTVEATTTTSDDPSDASVLQEESPCGPGVAIASYPSTVVPAFPRSVETHEVVAQVTVPEGKTLASLSAVTMCLYLIDVADCSHSALVPLNPRYALAQTWTEAVEDPSGTSGFRSVGTSLHQLGASRVEAISGSESYDSTQSTMTVVFSFKASGALSAARTWTLDVTATYDEPEIAAASDSELALVVTHASEFELANSTPDYGPIASGGLREVVNIVRGTYRTNAPTDYRLAGSSFCSLVGCPASELDLHTEDDLPPSGRVVLLCSAPHGTPVRLSVESQTVAQLNATGEVAESLTPLTCSLRYGGGVKQALQLHTSTIAVFLEKTPRAEEPG
jgi:hypothetical protein